MKKICFIIAIILALCMLPIQSLKDCVFAASDDLEIKSPAAYVCDYYSGKVVYEKNAEEKRPIASMTKVVSLAVVFDEINKGNVKLSDKITVSKTAADTEGSSAFLDAGSSYGLEELIKTIVIASANDSMVAISEHVSGTENIFAHKMNEYAKSIGMTNSNFENSTGLPSLNAYSTAKDMSKAIKQIIDNEIFNKYCKVWMDEIIHPSGRKTELVNTNRLVKTFNFIEGGKTGHTNTAKYCFVGVAKKGDTRIIASILGAEDSKTRFSELKDLYSYAFANYTNKIIVDNQKQVAEIVVKNAKCGNVGVKSDRNLCIFEKNNEIGEYKIVTKIEPQKAPLAAGTVVGKIYLTETNGVVVDEANLVTMDFVPVLSLQDVITKLVERW